jgi:hypothetical protein
MLYFERDAGMLVRVKRPQNRISGTCAKTQNSLRVRVQIREKAVDQLVSGVPINPPHAESPFEWIVEVTIPSNSECFGLDCSQGRLVRQITINGDGVSHISPAPTGINALILPL